MYCDHYGFREKPFTITPNPRFVFLSKNHREAFAHLIYGIDNHAGFILLTGEVGTGKTTVLRTLMEKLDDDRHRIALIFNPCISALELLRSINRMSDTIKNTRTEGEILIDGRNILDAAVDVVDLRQRVGLVFQRPNPIFGERRGCGALKPSLLTIAGGGQISVFARTGDNV